MIFRSKTQIVPVVTLINFETDTGTYNTFKRKIRDGLKQHTSGTYCLLLAQSL